MEIKVFFASGLRLHQKVVLDCSELHLVGGYCWEALGCGSKTAGLPAGRFGVGLGLPKIENQPLTL